MRGHKCNQPAMFYRVNLNKLVPASHPLRTIKKLADEQLAAMSARFDAAYSKMGRPSIPPEVLIKSALLQALYSIASEAQLCEQIGYNFMYRWFLDLSPEDDAWDHSVYSQNRDRFRQHGLLEAFFDSIVARAILEQAASNLAFSVDGTLIQSLASLKSVKPKDDDPKDPPDNNGWSNFKDEKRGNQTHQSATDPTARLARKAAGQAATLCHSLHVMMDNQSALLMDMEVTEANGKCEREASELMLRRFGHRHGSLPREVGEDTGYDDSKHIYRLERMGITPQVSVRRNIVRRCMDQPEVQARHRAHRRMRTAAYRAAAIARRGIEKIIGWLKERARLRRSRFFGRWKTKLYAVAAGCAYNLLRLANLKKANPQLV